MKITRLVLQTSDIPSVGNFYHSILGVSIKEESNDMLVLDIGETEIEFRVHNDVMKPFYHFAINIPANKIYDAHDWLQGKIKLLFIPDYNGWVADFKGWNAKSVYFYDPAGNIVELIARFDLDNASDENFSAGQLLSVSEIGLVFPADEINDSTKRLLTDFKLHYFAKQSPAQDFKLVW